MQNIFRNQGPKLSEGDIKLVEKEIGTEIPKGIVNFYLDNNGGFPDNGSWIVDGEEVVRVQCFLPMKERTKFANTIEATYKSGIDDDYLIRGLVPFARDFGGNYICFDKEGGIVFYTMDSWKSGAENDANKRQAMTPIIDSFDGFLSRLQPEPEY